ncbi:MAG: hypothetical protein P4L98_16800 [Ancalomicrobiaceae bacterium]|nr:hypothetical protein [Ancalomicrobiaceae bacterium]
MPAYEAPQPALTREQKLADALQLPFEGTQKVRAQNAMLLIVVDTLKPLARV